jgi:hypothetical protein
VTVHGIVSDAIYRRTTAAITAMITITATVSQIRLFFFCLARCPA